MEDYEMSFLNEWYGPDGGTEDGLMHRKLGDTWEMLDPCITLVNGFAVDYINSIVANLNGSKRRMDLAVDAAKCIIANLLRDNLDYMVGIYIPRSHTRAKALKDEFDVEWCTAARLKAVVDYLVYIKDIEREGAVCMPDWGSQMFKLNEEWNADAKGRTIVPVNCKKIIDYDNSCLIS